MPKRASGWLRGSIACVVLASFAALASVEVFVGSALLLMALGSLLLMPVGEELDRRFRGYRKLTSIAAGVFALSLPFIIAALGLLGAVTALVCFILVHRLLHEKQPRDYLYLLLMGFFVLLISCAQAPDATMGLAMLLFFISGLAALVSFQFYAEQARHDPQHIGRAYAGGAVPERAASFKAAWPAAVYGVICAAVAAALFLILPRADIGGPGSASTAQVTAGGGGPMAIPAGTEITQDPTPVFRASFPELPGGQYPGEKLWRCETGDDWDGRLWNRVGVSVSLGQLEEPGRRARLWDRGDGHLLVSPMRPGGDLVHQRIEPEKLPGAGLPALAFPKRVVSPAMALRWDTVRKDYSFRPLEPEPRLSAYDVWSIVETPSPEQLREAPGNYLARMSRPDYTLLTEARLEAETVQRADQLVAYLPTVYDKVMAVYDFFQGNDFIYSLNVTSLPQKNTIDAFVNDIRLGTCDHYATAMALMLRSQGIPTRVVRGYRGGEWQEDAYVVRESMAHLWVEVFFLEHGWVAFDPTPAEPLAQGPSLSRFRAWLRGALLRAQLFWFRDIVNYRGGLEWDLLKKAFLALGNVSVDDVSGLGEWGAVMLIVALRVFAPLALLAAAVALVRALLRRARPARRTWTLGPGQKRASALYRELRRTLEARGVATKGKTAGDLLQETAHYGPEVGMVREALTRYRLARFGARELPREDYRRLRAGLRRLRRQASVDSRSGLASGASGSG